MACNGIYIHSQRQQYIMAIITLLSTLSTQINMEHNDRCLMNVPFDIIYILYYILSREDSPVARGNPPASVVMEDCDSYRHEVSTVMIDRVCFRLSQQTLIKHE